MNTPHQEVRLRARIAALSKWAATADRSAATSAARTAFLRRFEAEVDPTGRLHPIERANRAEYARRAYMTRLALRSAAVRRTRSALVVPSSGAATPARRRSPESPPARECDGREEIRHGE